jgi:hypothetical protein
MMQYFPFTCTFHRKRFFTNSARAIFHFPSSYVVHWLLNKPNPSIWALYHQSGSDRLENSQLTCGDDKAISSRAI